MLSLSLQTISFYCNFSSLFIVTFINICYILVGNRARHWIRQTLQTVLQTDRQTEPREFLEASAKTKVTECQIPLRAPFNINRRCPPKVPIFQKMDQFSVVEREREISTTDEG